VVVSWAVSVPSWRVVVSDLSSPEPRRGTTARRSAEEVRLRINMVFSL
jgi:hypothetical protein